MAEPKLSRTNRAILLTMSHKLETVRDSVAEVWDQELSDDDTHAIGVIVGYLDSARQAMKRYAEG